MEASTTALDGWGPAAGFQQAPGAAHIGVQRAGWLAVGHVDDALRGQVHDRVDLVFAQGPQQQLLVADIAAHDLDLVEQPGAHQLRLRHPIAHQTDHIGAQREQAV